MASFITNTEPRNAEILNRLSHKAAIKDKKKDQSAEIRNELKRGLETIDLKMSLNEPAGRSANDSADSGTAHDAERAAWEKKKKRSKDYATKQHQIKYQLPESGNSFGKL